MDFNPDGDRYSNDLVNSSFYRELNYLLRFRNYQWVPKNIEVLESERRIYFDWYGNTCEDYIPVNYIQQLEQITADLHNERVYKPSFYTKYFYTDNNDQLHTYGFYSSSNYSEQPISMDFYRSILNPQRAALVERLEIDGKLDIGILVKYAFTDYIKWPGDPLPEIYHRVYQ